MQIQTVGDALTALSQLLGDLVTTQSNIVSSASDSWFSWGSDDLTSTAGSVVTQLTNVATGISNDLQGISADTPLTGDQIQRLQELQSEVISDRALINQSISSVDWTFGGIWDSAVTQGENLASQAITGVSQALGINWTVVILGIAAILAIMVYVRR